MLAPYEDFASRRFVRVFKKLGQPADPASDDTLYMHLIRGQPPQTPTWNAQQFHAAWAKCLDIVAANSDVRAPDGSGNAVVNFASPQAQSLAGQHLARQLASEEQAEMKDSQGILPGLPQPPGSGGRL